MYVCRLHIENTVLILHCVTIFNNDVIFTQVQIILLGVTNIPVLFWKPAKTNSNSVDTAT